MLLTANQNPPLSRTAECRSLAHEALQNIAAHNLRVPQDIAIVAFDDTWLSLMTTPPLTSIRQPLFEMGRQSIEMLVANIAQQQQPPRQVIWPVSLVVRESTIGIPLISKHSAGSISGCLREN